MFVLELTDIKKMMKLRYSSVYIALYTFDLFYVVLRLSLNDTTYHTDRILVNFITAD